MQIKKKLAQTFARTLVPAYFHMARYVKHALFVRRINSKDVKSPLHLLPVQLLATGTEKVTRIIKDEFMDYSLSQYSKLISKHYAKDGLAYRRFDDCTDEERVKQFESVRGRIDLFLKQDPNCFTYKDGESFLDVGCGPGQNIRILMENYPHSKIRGFDMNLGAVEVVRAATKANPNISVEVGSVLDFTFLRSFATSSIDHILISHVFGFLIDESVKKTRILRQEIVDELIRISKKSFLLMDNVYQLGDGEHWVNIEQKQRCTFVESLAPYFAKHTNAGRLKMFFSKENSALFFEKGNA